MKKHLIAAAVAAAVAVPAMAQVTVSGTIDTFVGSQDSGSTAADASNFTSGTDGFATTSFAFSGSEDLGGGLKAGFRLVKYFRSDTAVGSGAGSVTAATTDAFNTATVTVSGGFGAVTLGRNASNASEAFGVGRFGGNLGRVQSFDADVARESPNTISYTTPTINGITAELFRSNEQRNSSSGTTSGASNGISASAYSARYVQGPFALAVGRADGNTSATVKAKLTSAGAAFNLGFAKLGLVYIAFDPSSAVATDERQTTQFHAEIPLGNGVRVLGTFGKQEIKGTANGGSDHFVVGVEKALSKRTWVYAAHLSVDNEAAATFNLRGMVGRSSTASGQLGADPSTTMIGVRHNF